MAAEPVPAAAVAVGIEEFGAACFQHSWWMLRLAGDAGEKGRHGGPATWEGEKHSTKVTCPEHGVSDHAEAAVGQPGCWRVPEFRRAVIIPVWSSGVSTATCKSHHKPPRKSTFHCQNELRVFEWISRWWR